jgi:hypothetical protein
VNTYDPAQRIAYVRMAPEADPYAAPLMSTGRRNLLPAGYANKSPRTRLCGPAGGVTHGAEPLA